MVGPAVPDGGGPFVARVIRVLHPPPDPEPDETGAHEARSLSFALTADSVVLAGVLPRLEGEAVIAAVEAFAERLRSQADHVPASPAAPTGWSPWSTPPTPPGRSPPEAGCPCRVSVTQGDRHTLGSPPRVGINRWRGRR